MHIYTCTTVTHVSGTQTAEKLTTPKDNHKQTVLEPCFHLGSPKSSLSNREHLGVMSH